MLFNSAHFLVFFPVVVAVYFFVPHRYRWAWLLAASYYFYMAWRPPYVVILWAITAVDFAAGLLIGRARGSTTRRFFLGMSLCSNLLLLFAFKYFDFFAASIASALGAIGVLYTPPVFDLVLPLGISFHTFQAISYTVDVYRGKRPPERSLGLFALYIAFFPQLVAGPIERATHLLPQFYERHEFDYSNAVAGLRLMLWGFFKKLVIADRLAIFVNDAYAQPSACSGATLALATFFFAYQIYCDFSGYSDIAIGSARVMGFEIAGNFRRPFHADSVRDFWRRWHISLSTWFRDYLYVPLGGNRVSRARNVLNIFVVFLVSGLWHGANWTFIVWGALHGLFVVASLGFDRFGKSIGARRRQRGISSLLRSLAVLTTFGLTTFAWIFFRAASLGDAMTIVQRIFTRAVGVSGPTIATFGVGETVVAVVAIVALEAVHAVQAGGGRFARLSTLPLVARWLCYYLLLWSILLFGKFDERAFIYFQF
jgi:D-alanyl-lipoteichoic acid acyltransferase DltB (MBOAT superfamily)